MAPNRYRTYCVARQANISAWSIMMASRFDLGDSDEGSLIKSHPYLCCWSVCFVCCSVWDWPPPETLPRIISLSASVSRNLGISCVLSHRVQRHALPDTENQLIRMGIHDVRFDALTCYPLNALELKRAWARICNRHAGNSNASCDRCAIDTAKWSPKWKVPSLDLQMSKIYRT